VPLKRRSVPHDTTYLNAAIFMLIPIRTLNLTLIRFRSPIFVFRLSALLQKYSRWNKTLCVENKLLK
jgi:hypothetical protein